MNFCHTFMMDNNFQPDHPIRLFRYALIACVLIGSFFSAPYAWSQKKSSPSTTEDIAIAFYKTAQIQPNFKEWVKQRKPYSTTPIARRSKVMDQELNRLLTIYNGFSPLNDALYIKSGAYITPNTIKYKDHAPQYNLSILLDDKQDITYFPYVFLDQNYMVIPHGLEKFKNITITEQEYNFIRRSQGDKQNKQHLKLRLKPKKADISQPHDIDGIHQWAFHTDIAALEIWDASGRLIWQYSAPWYLSPQQKEMKSLYKEKRTLRE